MRRRRADVTCKDSVENAPAHGFLGIVVHTAFDQGGETETPALEREAFLEGDQAR